MSFVWLGDVYFSESISNVYGYVNEAGTKLLCRTKGRSNHTIVWTKGGKVMEKTMRTSSAYGGVSTLKFTPLKFDDGRNDYRCIVEVMGGHRIKSQDFTVAGFVRLLYCNLVKKIILGSLGYLVLDQPMVFADITVFIGQISLLQCLSKTMPKPTGVLMKRGLQVSRVSKLERRKPWWKIDLMQKWSLSDTGNYTCVWHYGIYNKAVLDFRKEAVVSSKTGSTPSNN